MKMSGIGVTMLLKIVFQLMVAGQSLAETSETRVLPSGYVAFPEYGSAYKLFTTEVTHSDAITLCSNENGQLAVIDSSDKVRNILGSFGALQWAWIGLHKPQDTEEWTTMDGKSSNNLPWASGEPNGLGRCVNLSRSNNGIGNNICIVKLAYLCEIALPRN